MNPYLISGSTCDQSIYETRTIGAGVHLLPAGTRGADGFGRVWYYTWNNSGTGLTVAELAVTPEKNHATQHDNLTVQAAAGVGTSVINVTLGATALLNQDYAGGFIVVNDQAGAGQIFRIKDHAAADASATATFNLYDRIAVALTTSSQVSFVLNSYGSLNSGPQQGNADQADMPVGVPAVALADGDAGWLQTWGESSVIWDEIVSAGVYTNCTIGTDRVGGVEMDDTATTVAQEKLVGITLAVTVDGEHNPIYLTIRP